MCSAERWRWIRKKEEMMRRLTRWLLVAVAVVSITGATGTPALGGFSEICNLAEGQSSQDFPCENYATTP